jgi:hypothetical protein
VSPSAVVLVSDGAFEVRTADYTTRLVAPDLALSVYTPRLNGVATVRLRGAGQPAVSAIGLPIRTHRKLAGPFMLSIHRLVVAERR